MLDLPHHDGSARYTEPGPYALGDAVTVRLRVPAAFRADRVRLRSVPDAEPLMPDARLERTDEHGTAWWVAELELRNPVTNYRFLLEGGARGHVWLNQAGLSPYDPTDGADFRLSVHPEPPAWLAGTVGYQIFVDRFATSGARHDLPDWAIPAAWDDPLDRDGRRGVRQFYGGDLPGIEKHLDHLDRLGVNLVYLTPFFPARTTHRYDASSFELVDPLLGGDEALSSLVDAAHRRGIRVIGDITLNHTGDHHDWFLRARADPAGVEAGFYFFGDGPDDYVSWHDVGSLPKLDHRSGELARRLYAGPDSVVARYLRPPFGLDGWRVDCANTTARFGAFDDNGDVARATRDTMQAGHPDTWLLAEHCFDAGADLLGDGWHGVMAYQWFTRPLWSWLRGDEAHSMMNQYDAPRIDGITAAAAMTNLAAPVPWTARQASMTMVDSHDSSRLLTAVGGDSWRAIAGLGALLTMPGVPTLFAGTEVGVRGGSMDGGRVPFPWDEQDWDEELLDAARSLIAVRRTDGALQRGGLRWLDAWIDSITFVREAPEQRTLVHLARRDGAGARLDAADLDGAMPGADAVTLGGAVTTDGTSIELAGDAPVTVVALPG